ncbi:MULTISPECIES: hypothetical protein [Pseudomonas]|uniref:Uncharacterized protein n=1 Tax=Pseudomonas rhodesiae TaxID=76760 RepID=A0A8I1JCI0_9PSED|nr:MULTISPECIES: hypothetical protein [Pseudomonas]MBI6605830.1 hypothetical protein [Pseudomonas sp. S4_EA_1b]MBI6623495.1 hypothetical protein [Pseudomonas rhodesiae]
MTDKIRISGAPPKWDDAEFEVRLQGWVNVYRGTTQCMEHVRSPLTHDFLELVASKVAEGYTVARNQAVTHEALNHSCWMIKPESHQQKDIDDIRIRVKAEYVEFLQGEHVRYQELLRQQLIQAAEAKEQKKLDDARNKRLLEIDKEVSDTYSPLVIPG